MKTQRPKALSLYVHPSVTRLADLELIQKRTGQWLVITGCRSAALKRSALRPSHEHPDPWGGDAA